MAPRWSIVALGLVAACTRPAPEPPAPSAAPLDRSTLDPTADACTDFYQYACGGFATPAHLPPDRDHVMWAEGAAAAANDRAIQQLLTGRDHADDRELARLRTFYASCMAAPADRTAEATLQRWLTRIDRLATRDDVRAAIRELHAAGIQVIFSYAGEPDLTDRARHRGELERGADTSPRLYTDRGPGADVRLAAYAAHVARMFELAGVAEAPREAAAAMRIRHELAVPQLAGNSVPEDGPVNRPRTRAQLQAMAPGFDWPAYLDLVGSAPDAQLNVVADRFLIGASGVLERQPIADLRAYLRWELLHALGGALPTRLADEHQRFASPAGVARPPRGEECQLETVKALGVELSHQFATRSIGPEVRDRARPIAERVRAEMVRTLPARTWLSPAARAATARKMAELNLKIGYPDRWPASGDFAIAGDTFLDNVLAARAYEQRRSWARVHEPRTRATWENTVYPNAASGMAAARLTIPNGFPDVFSNSIVFTAAFLRAPLVDPGAPLETSYGMFGAVVGHELVHMIEQHEFDRLGEQRETWSAEDVQAHAARRACVVGQAAAYDAFEGVHLDGEKTYDENVADLGGVAYAYAALTGELGPRLAERGADGFTRAQRFFLAYAQYYCQAERPEFSRDNLRGDPHAPVRYRVNAPLANLPAFAQAFGCAARTPMVRAGRCVVW